MQTEWWYRLDARDTIVEVGPGWDDFAHANGGAEAGRSLFDFVTGTPARQLVAALLGAVRSSTGAVEVPFRCDAPDRRRFMSWRGTGDGDGVRIRSVAGDWLEPEAASRAMCLFMARHVPAPTHGICPACRGAVVAGSSRRPGDA